MCHLSFYSSKLQIYPRWLCLQCWNIFLLPAGKMVSFISREPWRDPGRETAVGFCASSLLAGSYNALWPGHMVPLHGTSLRGPEGDFPVSQCSPSLNFSAIQWASEVRFPGRSGSQPYRAEDPLYMVSFLGDLCYL